MSHGPHDPVQVVNDKHARELLAIARLLGGHPEATSAKAERIDGDGIDVVLATPGGPVASRIDFPEPSSGPMSMRAAFRELAKRAQAAQAAVSHEPDAS